MSTITTEGVIHAVPRRVITSRVSECYKPNSGKLLGPVRYVVLHHCSLSHEAPGNPYPVPDEHLDMAMLSARFADLGLGTGGRVPYHCGTIQAEVNEQALPLSVRGTHAIGVNRESLAWVIIGEKRPASQRMLELAADGVAMLVLYTGGAEIVGHTDIAGASKDPGKTCPRPTVDVAQFRLMVRDRLPNGWRTFPRPQVEDIVSAAGFVV